MPKETKKNKVNKTREYDKRKGKHEVREYRVVESHGDDEVMTRRYGKPCDLLVISIGIIYIYKYCIFYLLFFNSFIL